MEENSGGPQIQKITEKVNSASLPADLKEKVLAMLERLKYMQNEKGFFTEFDSTSRYIDWVLSLPWNNSTKDILDLAHAKEVLDKSHFGLESVKDQILNYLSVMIVKNSRGVTEKFSRAPIISLVGLPGTGKTTISYSIAQALGRKIERIPFGGMGGAALLRGQSRVFPDAEPGYIVKALKRAASNNAVMLLDEVDRVSESARSDIMGVLVELLDPEQNQTFTDHYIDFPFDLSNILFIITSNNTKDISNAVLDRLEVLQMPSYTDEEKVTIAKLYMFPKILKEAGLTEKDIVVPENLWMNIARPLGYDPGMRTMQRTISSMVRQVARYIVEGKIQPGQGFAISEENMKEFIVEI